ncbi:MAG: exodeoxyribonuclease VII large subunit [bacterium]
MNVADHVYGVSELTHQIKRTIEGAFPPLWLKGELSNVLLHRSGHLYLTLKDDAASIKGVMWRTQAQRLDFRPENGTEVLVFGRLSVYEPRGEYQIVIEMMQPGGRGALAVEFERLKEKLTAEGLFDPTRKRPIPSNPRQLGVVTSETGAAVRDVLVTLARRGFGIDVTLAPARVQGEGAAQSVADALAKLQALPEPPDVIIIARGGGSLEDLWAFNEEITVRAIAACLIPVISGVGHETDTTLTDLAADLRAPTPTGAAERATPDRHETERHLATLGNRLGRSTWLVIENFRQRVDGYAGAYGLRRLPDRIEQQFQRLDNLGDRAERSIAGRLERLTERIGRQGDRLTALSPLSVLERGYAVVKSGKTVVRDVAELMEGQLIDLILMRGQAEARVEKVRPGEGPTGTKKPS